MANTHNLTLTNNPTTSHDAPIHFAPHCCSATFHTLPPTFRPSEFHSSTLLFLLYIAIPPHQFCRRQTIDAYFDKSNPKPTACYVVVNAVT